MVDRAIHIRGARTHNLRDLDLDLPRDAWTVVCGVSGSGKSSLVLDTLAAESRRRFLGTLQRTPRGMEGWPRPDVDRIEGLPPAVAAGFVVRRPGPRQTLGTITEVTHALRALFLRAAVPHCPQCGAPVESRTREAVAAELLDLPEGSRVFLLSPRGRGPTALEDVRRAGYVRIRVADGPIERLEDRGDARIAGDAPVDAVVDRLVVKPGAAERFTASTDQGLDAGGGVLRALVEAPEGETRELTFADRPYCTTCGVTWPRLSTSLFSFNGPAGACPGCEGRGEVPRIDPEKVLPRGMRFRRVASHLRTAVRAAERTAMERSIARAMRQADLDPDQRVADLPAAARSGLLGKGGAKARTGLLGRVARGGRSERLSRPESCPDCLGERLGPFPRAARVAGARLPELEAQSVEDLAGWLEALDLEAA
ncbi:MAG: excinuclease ABC subunit UvrA, partial [Planctomycetota bacterium]